MSLPSRLLGANPSIQVSTLLSGTLTTPSAKGIFVIPTSFESIASTTGTGTSDTITFNSIPSTYASLHLRTLTRSNESGSGTNITLYFNGDSGGNYAQHRLQGEEGVVSAAGTASSSGIFSGRAPGGGTLANTMAVNIFDIHDYASTTKSTTVRIIDARVNDVYASSMKIRSGLWTTTSAVTSIALVLDGSQNFSTSSTFCLYGIKGA